MEEHFHLFRKCNYDTQNANWSKERRFCTVDLYTFCKPESILVCKLVTVSRLSRYSGCKCILTLNRWSRQGRAHLHISPPCGPTMAGGTVMIAWMCLWGWFQIFATIVESREDAKKKDKKNGQLVYFGVCRCASDVFDLLCILFFFFFCCSS